MEHNIDEELSQVECARSWCISVYYIPRIVAMAMVLMVDRAKPCDQPLWVAVLVLMAVDVGKLAIRKVSHEVPASTERKRAMLMLEIVHLNALVMVLICFWRTRTCSETSPNLWGLVLALLLMHLSLLALCSLFLICGCVLLSMATLLRYFGVLDNFGPPGLSEAASAEMIDSLPVVRYEQIDVHTEDEEEGNGSMCAICLDGFQCHDELRQLPCQHQFHVSCVDDWLRINKKCPLCKRDIDQPL